MLIVTFFQRRMLSIRCFTSLELKGLRRKSAAPFSRQLSFSSSDLSDMIITTGLAKRPFPFNRSSRPLPSRLCISRLIITRAILPSLSCNVSITLSSVSASRISYSSLSIVDNSSLLAISSSTIKILSFNSAIFPSSMHRISIFIHSISIIIEDNFWKNNKLLFIYEVCMTNDIFVHTYRTPWCIYTTCNNCKNKYDQIFTKKS